jgi:uncharacterized protein YciI
MYFSVRRVRGPAWDAARGMREQDNWAGHAAFMDGLAAEGFIVLGGPVGPGDKEFLFVIYSESEEALRARLAADPWSESDLLEIARVEPWTILLDSRRP